MVATQASNFYIFFWFFWSGLVLLARFGVIVSSIRYCQWVWCNFRIVHSVLHVLFPVF
jgi:hypothetical protein